MCLSVEKGPLVAESNIIVFKTGDLRFPLFQRFSSAHHDFRYKRFQKQENVELSPKYGTINRGYHSFSGFGLSMFVIPKGATYYQGNHENQGDGYTSSSIIWIGSVFNPVNWLIALIKK